MSFRFVDGLFKVSISMTLALAIAGCPTPPAEELPPEGVGYDTLHEGGLPPRGERHLITVLMRHPEREEDFRHDREFYQSFLHGPGVTMGQSGVSIRDYFLENSYGAFTWADGGIFGPFEYVVPASGELDANTKVEQVYKILAEDVGIPFDIFDLNRDGRVTNGEVGILIIDNDSLIKGEVSEKRCLGARGLETEFCGRGAITGSAAGIMTTVKALTRMLGGFDIAGTNCHSYRASSMSCTEIEGYADNANTVHIDGWHKMRFGWVEPRVFNFDTAPGGCVRLLAPEWDGAPHGADEHQRPVILTSDDPDRRFESFLFTYHSFYIPEGGPAVIYDINTAGAGVVAWHVATDRNFAPLMLPALNGSGFDAAIFQFSGVPGERGVNKRWGSASAPTPVELLWIDGTPTGVMIDVGAVGASHPRTSLEWGVGGFLPARVDSVTLESREHGTQVVVRGMLGARARGRAVTLIAGGNQHEVTVSSWSCDEIVGSVNATIPTGTEAAVSVSE